MKLLNNSDYLLLIDEGAEIKKGEIAIHNFGMGYKLEIPCDKDNLKSNTRFKVISYYPLNSEAKELDLPLLPNPFEKNVDVFGDMRKIGLSSEQCSEVSDYFDEKFKSKQFSLEDMRKIAQAAFTIKSNNETLIEDFDKWFEKKIQSLSTQQLPKKFIPEYETVTKGTNEFDFYEEDIFKITINSEGKEVICGTYEY